MHQANVFMVNYVRKKLKVRSEVTPTNVTNFGNTGPATIPLLLSDLCSTNNYDLSRVVMSGFGVGLSWGSVATDLLINKEMREKVLAIINEIRATKELPAVSSLNVNDNLRNNLDLTSFDLAELTVRIEDEFDIDIFEDGLVNTIGEVLAKLEK